MMPKFFLTLWIAGVSLFTAGQSQAEQFRVAVASNFSHVIKELSARFEAKSGHKVILSFASTGKHYAQIKNGAPFDAFFAADSKRPVLLEKEGLALPDSRFTYAIGRIVLWSPIRGLIDSEGDILEKGNFRYLAMANPKLAPYGMAAAEVLKARGVWEAVRTKIVRGENVNQAFQFVKSGNAELGFLAYSQIRQADHVTRGSLWEVPQALYTPIEQQAVLLTKSKTAQDFMTFVKSTESLALIHRYGYGTP